MKSIRITLLAGLAALAAAIAPAAARPAPAAPLPAPTGAAPVGTLVLRLVDTSRVDPFAPEPRARELLLRFWYPAAGRSGEPTPYFAPRVAALYADQLNIPTRILTAFSVPARTNARPQAGRHPVVLFSPGFGVPSSNYALLLDDLASHGYVVLAIDHPYEAPLVFPGGRLVPPRSATTDATTRARRPCGSATRASCSTTWPRSTGTARSPGAST
jgi:predicted dienelactone hydrolase